jgi:hypothetical protein
MAMALMDTAIHQLLMRLVQLLPLLVQRLLQHTIAEKIVATEKKIAAIENVNAGKIIALPKDAKIEINYFKKKENV